MVCMALGDVKDEHMGRSGHEAWVSKRRNERAKWISYFCFLMELPVCNVCPRNALELRCNRKPK